MAIFQFICSELPNPIPKWMKYKRTQSQNYTCSAQLSAVPLQIREKIWVNEASKALEAVGFVAPRNLLIDEESVS